MKISAVILAGGKNTRMKGKDKAFLLIRGKPVIERTVSNLQKIFKDIVIVTNSPAKYSKFKVKVVKDRIRGLGPLGGIYTGLCNIKNEAAFFIACDMPFLHNGIIKKQIRYFSRTRPDCLIARCKGVQPLHAIYTKKTLPLISQSIKSKELSLKKFIGRCPEGKFISFSPRKSKYFSNINSRHDLRRIDVRG